MKVTVAVCTWNRCALLRQTLERMTELVIPSRLEWEVVVVNNRSTDATDQVIAEFENRLPLRRVFEQEPGLSNARNAAIRESRGAHIIWTDDDVLVDAGWLTAYLAAFARWPGAAFFGGPIEPLFENQPPEWLRTGFLRVRAAYAALNLGPDPVRFGGTTLPYGANMAVRRGVYDRVRYDPDLGLRPGSSMRGEETAMAKSLSDAGEEGWWIPGARVAHFIPQERQTISYLRAYYVGWGEYLGRGARPGPGMTLLGRPLWLWREVIETEARYRGWRALGKPDRWLEALKIASTAWGRMRWYGAGYSSRSGAGSPWEPHRKYDATSSNTPASFSTQEDG